MHFLTGACSPGSVVTTREGKARLAGADGAVRDQTLQRRHACRVRQDPAVHLMMANTVWSTSPKHAAATRLRQHC